MIHVHIGNGSWDTRVIKKVLKWYGIAESELPTRCNLEAGHKLAVFILYKLEIKLPMVDTDVEAVSFFVRHAGLCEILIFKRKIIKLNNYTGVKKSNRF